MEITKEQYYALKGLHTETTKLHKQVEVLRRLAHKIVGSDPESFDVEFDEIFMGVLLGDFDSQLKRNKIEVIE